MKKCDLIAYLVLSPVLIAMFLTPPVISEILVAILVVSMMIGQVAGLAWLLYVFVVEPLRRRVAI